MAGFQPEQEYELKLSNSKVVEWVGTNGEDACRRYASCHPGTTVVAWRTPRYQLVIGAAGMVD